MRSTQPAQARERAQARARSGVQQRILWLGLSALGAAIAAYALFLLLAAGSPGRAEDAPAKVDVKTLMAPGPLPENVQGKADAPVTIIEYSSMTCPHCAAFHKDTLPALRKKYIDTGKVRYIIREYPLDNLAAAAALVARCIDPANSVAFVDMLYQMQEEWAFTTKNPRESLFELAKQTGMTRKTFDACLANKDMLRGIIEIRARGNKEFKVQSTPTFFINGTRLEGAQPIEAFAKIIDPLLKK